jgi:hypothetical protein
MLKFRGSLSQLQELVRECVFPGEWQLQTMNGFYRFRAETGAILNWWPTTGTINFQGQDADQFEALLLGNAPWLSCDSSVWAPVPDCTLPPDGLHGTRRSAATEKRRRPASRPSQRLGSRVIELLPAPHRDGE